MATVSVIIPTFNRAGKVVRAISSVLSQTFTDLEIIIVDDGSMDGTKDTLAKFRNKIKYIYHSLNLGVSAARNSGIKKSTAPFISFLDSDDYWLPEKLAEQIAFFERNPNAPACQTEEIWIRNGRRVNPRKIHRKPSGDIFEPSLKLCLVSPSAVILKRVLLEEVGLFDEDLPACEDYALWLRISCRYPVYLIKRPLVVKEGGHSDQLSARYKGMDKFRIKALVKLIKSGVLNERQLQATFEELSLKCRIYSNGCVKRGKLDEGTYYLQLPEILRKELAHSCSRVLKPLLTMEVIK
ncbi:MAG: glycosyltransferase [Deltaproteobacteria bacterium]|nr:glycosyltransferase [Deltaproteobacteria bacterium]MBW2169780.1 glycosyltransferase [Deltaproteobacteria bacterium]MBW2358199.1 glycosyltransferase [Deltaproteobacteria bacterium]